MVKWQMDAIKTFGGDGVPDKLKKAVSYILAIGMLFSCIYMENTDTVFAHTLEEETIFYISNQNVICDSHVMVMSDSNVCMATVTRPRNDIRITFDVLCEDIYSQISGKCYTKAEDIESFDLYNEILLLKYIHNSDGKKRSF